MLQLSLKTCPVFLQAADSALKAFTEAPQTGTTHSTLSKCRQKDLEGLIPMKLQKHVRKALCQPSSKKVGKGKEGQHNLVPKEKKYYQNELAFKPNHAQSARSFSFIFMFPFQKVCCGALMNFTVLTLS